MNGYVHTSASFSACGRYRYTLTRRWGVANASAVLWIMLNPSTAGHHVDDSTIRKCVRYSKRWGYGGLSVVNLYAWIATNPDDLRQLSAAEAVGPDNLRYLHNLSDGCDLAMCAWGATADYIARRTGHDQAAVVLRQLGPTAHALKITKSGAPGHPLYLRGDLKPFRMGVRS